MAIDFIKNPTPEQANPKGYNYWKPGMAEEDKPGIVDVRSDVESMRREELIAHPERAQTPAALKEAIEGKPIENKNSKKGSK